MTTTPKLLLAAAALVAACALAAPAEAGGSTSVTRDGRYGGHAQRDTSCAGGAYAGRCSTDWSYTGPQGRSWSGERDSIYGPRRVATRAHTTGPGGATVGHGGVWWRR